MKKMFLQLVQVIILPQFEEKLLVAYRNPRNPMESGVSSKSAEMNNSKKLSGLISNIGFQLQKDLLYHVFILSDSLSKVLISNID